MAKKKKRGLNLVALLLVLVVLIGAYVAYSSYEKKQADKEDAAEDAIEVLKIEENDIQSISYKNEKADLTLVKNSDATWVNEANPQVPLNSTYTNKMASSIASVTASKIVTENAEDLSEFGLKDPALAITVTKKDNSEVKLSVGSKSPLGDGYYACIDGETRVYLVAQTLVTAFDYEESALTDVADAPTITAANITHLQVNDPNGGVLEITYDKDNPYDTSDTGMSPYVLNQGYDVPISGDSTNITTYLGNFTSLSYGKCVDYDPTDLAQFGLNEPKATVSIDYFEEETGSDSTSTDTTASGDNSSAQSDTVRKAYSYTLQIGSLNEEDSVYYVKDAASNSVYTMAQATVEKMFAYKLFDLVNKYPQLINVKSIDEVCLMYEGETHTLSVKHETTTDSDGQETENESFALDGTEYDEDSARTLYQSLIGPMYDAEIPEGYTDADKPVIASFVFKRTTESGNSDLTTEYKEYDDSFYTVTVNGQEKFLVDKRDIQNAIKDMKDALN